MSSYQKVNYDGKLASYQRYGNKLYKQPVQYEKDPFNSYQNFLYKRALFGLAVYTQEELVKMHTDKKKRIEKVHIRAQSILNVWKQELCNQWSVKLLEKLFWHSKLIKEINEKFGDELDPSYISKVDFKSLGVQKLDIVNKLIQEKILPNDFYKLTERA
jgi:hypothetical protein